MPHDEYRDISQWPVTTWRTRPRQVEWHCDRLGSAQQQPRAAAPSPATMRAATLIWTAQTVAVSGTLPVVVCARLKTCKDNYAFLAEKMEDSFYWWELLLLLRKLLIMAARMLNTSSPSRGWFLSSLVIVFSLGAHSYARPYEDPWVDAAEALSLWTGDD